MSSASAGFQAIWQPENAHITDSRVARQDETSCSWNIAVREASSRTSMLPCLPRRVQNIGPTALKDKQVFFSS